MRKTMIFRFSSLAVLCALVAAPGVRAQQDQQTHVVVEGETLWAIASNYFGDPFLWPEIYRINTDVVEDPHWIFPGEVLRLQPMEQVAIPEAGDTPAEVGETLPAPEIGEVAPTEGPEVQQEGIVRVAPPEVQGAAPPPPPPSEMAPTIFARVGRTSVIQADFGGPPPRPVSRGTFYSAGFLTEGETLPWGVVVGVVGRANLSQLRQTSAALIYQELEIAPPEGGTYAIGDSLLLAETQRRVDDWGQIVRPSGIAVVRRPSEGGYVVAQLVQQYHSVMDGQGVLPLEPFRDPGAVVPVPVERGMTGTVLAARDPNPLPGQQRIVYVDLGSSDGVSLGDVFEMQAADQTGASFRTVATLQIVHTRRNTASGIILNIRDFGIGPGASVRLVRKMPS